MSLRAWGHHRSHRPSWRPGARPQASAGHPSRWDAPYAHYASRLTVVQAILLDVPLKGAETSSLGPEPNQLPMLPRGPVWAAHRPRSPLHIHPGEIVSGPVWSLFGRFGWSVDGTVLEPSAPNICWPRGLRRCRTVRTVRTVDSNNYGGRDYSAPRPPLPEPERPPALTVSG
jgi:hypothetical protein